ncbi:MAG: immunity 22 family protein [Bacillota bacterium]
MENPGVLSLWLGNFPTEDELKQYVELKFNKLGDRISSKFMQDFNIDFVDYNQDLLERTFINHSTKSLKVLLKGSSYEDKLLPQLIEHYGESIKENFNSVIRLYDFEYNEVVDEVKSANKNILFMGAVTYEEWDE